MRVNESADAAVLAAADAMNGWITADPCTIASTVVAHYAVDLESCIPVVASGVVTVCVSSGSVFGRAHASARAG